MNSTPGAPGAVEATAGRTIVDTGYLGNEHGRRDIGRTLTSGTSGAARLQLAPSRVVAASDSTTDLGVNRLPSATCLEAGEPAVQILRGSS
jgi:hypothetical protein